MKFSKIVFKTGLWSIATVLMTVTACKKSDNPNNLPDIDPKKYEGKVDGYLSSDEIYPSNLVAYWNFDGNTTEKFSNSSPTTSSNQTFKNGGIKGQALNLNGGFLHYAKQFDAFKTTALKSFTISTWVQVLNNGSKKTMVFQLARPGIFNGNINFVLETNTRQASVTDAITIHPTFNGQNGGMQDNLNAANGTFPFQSPKIGTDVWAHMVITYDAATGIFQVWGNGVKIGVPAWQNRGTDARLFNSFEPSEVIIGGNYNVIPGKSVSTDVSFAPMVGSIDELRVYNIALPDAHIRALYNLGLAGK